MTLMIGANDFFLCQETTSDGCAGPTEQAAVAKRVTANIESILSAIRKTAHYRGQLAIVNYYSLNYASPATNAQSQLLNQVQDAAAKPFHVVIANGFGEWRTATARFAGNSLRGGAADAARHARQVRNPPELRRPGAAGPGAREGHCACPDVLPRALTTARSPAEGLASGAKQVVASLARLVDERVVEAGRSG